MHRRCRHDVMRWALAVLVGAMAGSAVHAQAQGAASPDAQAPSVSAPSASAPADGRPGMRALLRTAAGDVLALPRRRSTWVILGIGAAAAAAGRPYDADANGHLAGPPAIERLWAPGKWAGATYLHAGVATGLYVAGRLGAPDAVAGRPMSKASQVGIDLLRAQLVSQAFVQGMKASIRRDRPTGECCAFPSGHSASAFAAASVLERHFGRRAAWPALALAAYVAASRLHDNRHYLSDVMFGSALGIASGWTVTGTRGRPGYTVGPAPVRGGVAFVLTRRLAGDR